MAKEIVSRAKERCKEECDIKSPWGESDFAYTPLALIRHIPANQHIHCYDLELIAESDEENS